MIDTKIVLGRHLHVLLEEDGEGHHRHLSWIHTEGESVWRVLSAAGIRSISLVKRASLQLMWLLVWERVPQ